MRKLVPRSALFGQTMEDGGHGRSESMPGVQMMRPAVGHPGTNAHQAMPVQHQVALLKGAVVKVRADRDRIVKEANAKLGALATRVRQLEGALRTAYSPNAQTPEQGQVDQGVPTHALRNPHVYGTDGGVGAPEVMTSPANTGHPGTNAGHPGTNASSVHAESVRAAEDAIFYGNGDAAFYEGGEND